MTAGDFEVWRGNSYQVVGWAFPFAIAADEIILKITWPDGGLTKSTASGGLTVVNGTIDGVVQPVVYWTPSVAESRLIPLGREAKYELERRVAGGEQRTYASGYVIGVGGDNND